jgi:hypothetical protein
MIIAWLDRMHWSFTSARDEVTLPRFLQLKAGLQMSSHCNGRNAIYGGVLVQVVILWQHMTEYLRSF